MKAIANHLDAHRDSPDSDPGDSKTLITMHSSPNQDAFKAKQRNAFKTAFVQTLKDETEGAMSTYLFYDLNPDSNVFFQGLTYDAPTILSGGRAWERRIKENVNPSINQNQTTYFSGDKRIINHALQNGLLALLPKKIQYVSYGGGDEQAFTTNEGQIIKATQADSTMTITGLCAVDILPRYVDTMTYVASRRYTLDSQGVQGDFLRNGRLAISRSQDSTPVVMIFGGPFENVSVDAQNPDAHTNVAIAWGKMNIQHGLGSFVVKTFDADQNPLSQDKKYAPTRDFEAFELSFFARAVEDGIIKNPDYDVFEHWRLASAYSPADQAQKIYAECKKDHTLETDAGDYSFKSGDRRTITLSHKWDIAVHQRAVERAGYAIRGVFEEPGNKNILIVAEAVGDPDPDIMQHIPYVR
jgi:hypothetical protein